MAACSYFWLLSLLSSVLGVAIFQRQPSQLPSIFRSESPVAADDQPHRTAFHFQPPSHWMNDPNGPMIYKGIYHLFYQYYPNGAVWNTRTEWGHSTSTDLVNWVSHPSALLPTDPYDINGCWSGSATILQDGTPAILYTGIGSEDRQTQNLAVPKNLSDPFLVEWVKSPHNPVMEPTPQNKIKDTFFRDPTTAWVGPDGKYRVVVGNERDRDGYRDGVVLLFKSSDFVNWVEAHDPFHTSKDTGMVECPDFFPVSTSSENGLDTSEIGSGVKHVYKAGLFYTFKDYYTVGRYDHENDVYIPDPGSVDDDSGLRYDYGRYYASKSFFDGSMNRRVLLGWVNEATNTTIDTMKGWSGLQAFPRKIWLDKSGKQLVQWPITEIEKLRHNYVNLPARLLKGGSVVEVSGISAAQADVEISFEVSAFERAELFDPSWTNPQDLCSQKGASVKEGLGPFGLLVLASKDLQEYTAVFFRIFKAKHRYIVLMCSDLSKSSSGLDYDKPTYGAFLDVDPTKEKLSLRSVIDHSIVESIGGEGKAWITARVYPTLAINGGAFLYVFNNGTGDVKMSSLNAWSMKMAQIN